MATSPATTTPFQSTLLRKERLFSMYSTAGTYLFQSTLLRKERLLLCFLLRHGCRFNPRSYERSDKICQDICVNPLWVSIHAPTKGATMQLDTFFDFYRVSIHAPTKGATAILHKSSSDFVLFLSNYTSSCFTLQAG